jgi:hypothetical protein
MAVRAGRADRADCDADADAYIEGEYEKIVCEISEHSRSLVGKKKNYFDGKKDSTFNIISSIIY